MLCILIAILPGCATMPEAKRDSEMYQRASALTKLSAAMEAYVRFGNPAPSLTSEEMLAEGTAHDPALLTNVGDFTIKVLARERHAVVLMCTKAGDSALLEDAGCTAPLETHHWQQARRACNFTVDVAIVCARGAPAVLSSRQ
jgi:hypothetical protein